jgi:hypothetical protein
LVPRGTIRSSARRGDAEKPLRFGNVVIGVHAIGHLQLAGGAAADATL